MSRMLIAALAGLTTLTSAQETRLVIGYLTQPRYDMQNSYLSKLVQAVADTGLVQPNGAPADADEPFDYEFNGFNTNAELEACLSSE